MTEFLGFVHIERETSLDSTIVGNPSNNNTALCNVLLFEGLKVDEISFPEPPGTGSVPSVLVCLLPGNCDLFIQLTENIPLGIGYIELGTVSLLQSD
jgi:hypothetical protein